ncbi:hypothetical protein BCR32DRAFT_267041 [Anaeromyces robustus]|uniref:DUF4298 domain-containing protein n=1 Tax=Anaeromyces robustus TaxID=1754192 RepID=A0A1Y1XCD4_9FUNG|nr:hypothetical protein BCR32DRAFT_267041 [Anaeromyces robustus]|eukprot:ORX83385.1 hypothetical protein BCR32DRAFT_267041 [Anaeromyces robustus]
MTDEKIKRIERIKKMEEKLDDVTPKIRAFEVSLNNMKKLYEDMKILSEYYSNEWKKDFVADEEGEIPKDLKRGVLGEDTLYDLFCDYYQIGDDMKELSEKIKALK